MPIRITLLEFDQTEFFDTGDAGISMHEAGHVYVPEDCVKKNGNGGCRLHIAFHGCEQSQELIRDEFYARAGYNEWAEANRIIILYPQTKKWDVRVVYVRLGIRDSQSESAAGIGGATAVMTIMSKKASRFRLFKR